MNTRRAAARLVPRLSCTAGEDGVDDSHQSWTEVAQGGGRRAKLTSSTAKRSHGAINSLSVFRSFMIRDQTGLIAGVEGLFSRKCLDAWLSHRTRETLAPREETYQESFIRFRRSLMAHISGSDGRVPFDPEEETAILNYIRQKDVWSEFGDVLSCSRNYKCRTKGFHETEMERRMGCKIRIKRQRKSYAETTATDSSGEDDNTLITSSTSTSPVNSLKRIHVDAYIRIQEQNFCPLPTPTSYTSSSHSVNHNNLFEAGGLDDVELSIVEELCF